MGAAVMLGDGKNYTDVSLYSGKPLPSTLIPIVYAAKASNSTVGDPVHAWDPHRLTPEKVTGKLVLPISMQYLLRSLSATTALISLSAAATWRPLPCPPSSSGAVAQ